MNIKLVFPVRDLERLIDDQSQNRTCKIRLLVAAIDNNFSGTGLDPNPGNRVFTFAGSVGAALGIDHGFNFNNRGGFNDFFFFFACYSLFRSFLGLFFGCHDLFQVIQSFLFLNHY